MHKGDSNNGGAVCCVVIRGSLHCGAVAAVCCTLCVKPAFASCRSSSCLDLTPRAVLSSFPEHGTFTERWSCGCSLLMQGLAASPADAHKADPAAKLQYPQSAAVSIAAKPVTPSFAHRSAAMPIALKRPIRKVSFSDLSAMDQSESYDQQSASMQTSLPRKSGSFSRSYSLRDAISNRIPHSPDCSNHLSQGSDSDESKIRGGHHFDSDHVSSSDSLSHLEQSLSGLPETPTTLSSPCDTLSSSTQSPTTTHGTDASPHGLIPSHTASYTASQTASGIKASLPESPGERQQGQLHGSCTQLGSAWVHPVESPDQLEVPTGCDDERSSCGWKTHGGNLFKQGRSCYWSACQHGVMQIVLRRGVLGSDSVFQQVMRGSFARRQVGNGKVGGRGVGGEGHDGGRPHLRREVSRKQAQPFDKLHSITNAWQYVSQVSTFYARA